MPTVEDRRSRLTPAQRTLLAKRLRGDLKETPAEQADDAWKIAPRPEGLGLPAPISSIRSRAPSGSP